MTCPHGQERMIYCLRCLRSNEHLFWPKVDIRKPPACSLWQGGTDARGYGMVRWFGYEVGRDTGQPIKAHRLAFAYHHGYFPERVLHTCDVHACVQIAHLYDGTQKQNMRDARRNGRLRVGERHPKAKVSDAQVEEMIAMREDGVLLDVIAAQFGIHASQVSRITRGLRGRLHGL